MMVVKLHRAIFLAHPELLCALGTIQFFFLFHFRLRVGWRENLYNDFRGFWIGISDAVSA